MSGTSLVILAMYSTVDVVTTHGAGEYRFAPLVLGLLMTAAALTCAGTVMTCRAGDRTRARGAIVEKAQRRLTGPRERRS